MTNSKNIKINIENKESIIFFYYYNQNTTFNDLLEFVSYYFPDLNICPCYKFQINDVKEIKNDEKIIDYIIKNDQFHLINSNQDKVCKCNSSIKGVFKLSKMEILKYFDQLSERKDSLDVFKKRTITIENEKSKVKKSVTLLNDKIINYEKENSNLKENIQKLELELEKKNNELKNNSEEIKKLKQKNELLELGINGDIDTITKLENLGYDIGKLKLKENSIKINPKSNEIMSNETPNLEPNFINFYDVIIDIKSIKDISKGWEIKKSKRAEENYEDFKKDKIIKIGVIGNSNKGKSFILSKISKIDLPSGTSIRTEGLSIKYPELDLYKDRKIALLDSAGLETPVLKENNNLEEGEENDEKKEEITKTGNEIENKKNIEEKNEKELFKEKSREKLITELFLQNYIINNSDILLVVVGILTYSEQKLLNRIKTEIQRAKINKPLFIIHNLITYTSIEQVKQYINNFLLKSATFNLEKGHKISTKTEEKSGIYFYEKKTDPKIFHLIFANEGSEAGKYYNKFTLDFLEGEFQRVTDLKTFDVIKTVKERFIESSKDFLEKMDKPLELNDFDNKENKFIKLIKEKNVTLKKCLIDELGFSNLKANGFEPTYNYYKKDDKIIIRVEAPGNSSIKSNVDSVGEYKIIRLKGNKKKDKEPEKLEDNLFNSRESGLFSLDIPLKNEDFLLKNELPTYSEKKGVFIIEFKLEEKKIDKGFEVNEDDEI